MAQFGATREELEGLGVQLFGVSGDTPFAHKVWSEQLQPGYPFMSDRNWEAARAFGILHDELFDCYRPCNTRAAFLVGKDGVVRYAQVSEPTVLPDAQAALAAARVVLAY